jgi:hypothetical protein
MGLPANSFDALSVWIEPGPLCARAAHSDSAHRGGGSHQKPSPPDARSVHHFRSIAQLHRLSDERPVPADSSSLSVCRARYREEAAP